MLHDIMIDPRQLKAAAEWAESEIDFPAPVAFKMVAGNVLRVGQGDSRAAFQSDGTCASDTEGSRGGIEEQAKMRATCSMCLARTYRHEECLCDDGGDAEDFDEVRAELQGADV